MTGTLTFTLIGSMVLGAIGLMFFLWGLRSGQFDDAEKFTHGALFDGPEELRAAKEREDRLKKAREENKKTEESETK